MAWNPLQDEYNRYKQGHRETPIQPTKKGYQDYEGSDFGVPDPIMDSQFESDVTSIRACPKCGSYNISFDMSSNKTTCNDCKANSDKPARVDFQKKMEQANEEEQNRINEALRRGDRFL